MILECRSELDKKLDKNPSTPPPGDIPEGGSSCTEKMYSQCSVCLNMRRPVLIEESVVAPPITSSRKLM